MPAEEKVKVAKMEGIWINPAGKPRLAVGMPPSKDLPLPSPLFRLSGVNVPKGHTIFHCGQSSLP